MKYIHSEEINSHRGPESGYCFRVNTAEIRILYDMVKFIQSRLPRGISTLLLKNRLENMHVEIRNMLRSNDIKPISGKSSLKEIIKHKKKNEK